MITVVGIASITYNACLAFLNAHGLPQSFASVAVSEIAITIIALLAIGRKITGPQSGSPFLLVSFGILLSIFSSAWSGVSVDAAHNFALIGVFYLVGLTAEERQVVRLFRIASVIVLCGLVLEIARLQSYVWIFQPAEYYQATRGLEKWDLDETGLFKNALGFEGRLTFGFVSHRTSSIFLEQVSLANFSSLLSLFILSKWDSLSPKDIVVHFTTIVAVILTNVPRTSMAFITLSFVGYFIYPRLSPRLALLTVPFALFIGAIVYAVSDESGQGDNFVGRVSENIDILRSFTTSDILGMNATLSHNYMDAGFAYVISASGFLGLLLIWFFSGFVLDGTTKEARRCLFGVNTFIVSNLMIAGTAVFSIKVAAPLWILVGSIRRRETSRSHDRKSSKAAALTSRRDSLTQFAQDAGMNGRSVP